MSNSTELGDLKGEPCTSTTQ